jgi:hypothetical protein
LGSTRFTAIPLSPNLAMGSGCVVAHRNDALNQLIFGVEMGRVWFRNFQICLWGAKVKSAWNWWRKQRLQLDPRIPPVTVIFPEKLGRSMTNRSFCHSPSKKRYWIGHVGYVPLYCSQTKVIG